MSERIRRGSVPVEVARFGAPLALGMGLQVTFNLVDAYLISRLPHPVAGPALGAIGICDQLAALGTIVSYGLSVATGAIVSRKQGAGDAEGVRAAAPIIAQGRKVLVHCHYGRHRSVAMAAAILIAQGATAREAMAMLSARRASADPHIWYIRRQIEKFERHWRERNPA